MISSKSYLTSAQILNNVLYFFRDFQVVENQSQTCANVFLIVHEDVVPQSQTRVS